MFHLLEHTTSTNDLAKAEGHHGDLFAAEHQSAGRGQRGNKWHSGAGLNLTFSLVVEPKALETSHQFFISMVAALALVDLLREQGLSPRVKWTNDIYIGDRKIAGILIENSLSGKRVARSVVGIGLNVNQEIFDPLLPNPTSMARESGRTFLRIELLKRLHEIFFELFEKVECEGRGAIFERYNELLYRRGESHQYMLADGTLFDGVIEGIEATGALIISRNGGEKHSFQFKEVEFLIPRQNLG